MEQVSTEKPGELLSDADTEAFLATVQKQSKALQLFDLKLVSEFEGPHAPFTMEISVNPKTFFSCENVLKTVKHLIADATSRDIEYIVFGGDKSSEISLLNQMNGILKEIKTNVLSIYDQKFCMTSKFFARLLKCHDQVALKKKKDQSLYLFCYRDHKQEYCDYLATRMTAHGDGPLPHPDYVQFSNVPIISSKEISQDHMLLIDPKQVHIELSKEIRIELSQVTKEGTIRFLFHIELGVFLDDETEATKVIIER